MSDQYPFRLRLEPGEMKMQFIAYQPDSHSMFHVHPEFDGLYEKFIKYNVNNNSGDVARLWSILLNCKQVMDEGIEGDFAELGVWRGNTAAILAYFAAHNKRELFLFDTYEGFSSKDIRGIDATKPENLFRDTSIEMVKEVIGEHSSVCHFEKGYFPDSVKLEHKTKKYSVVSLDCDLYEPTRAGLEFFYPMMPRGSIFLLHDYSSLHWAGSKKAIDEFCNKTNEYVILMPDKSGSAFIRRTR
jgi:hypothetical protein